MRTSDKKNDHEPGEIVAEFYRSFCEQYSALFEESFGEPPSEEILQKSFLNYIKIMFHRRRNRWEVDDLFAKLGPRKKRADGHFRRGQLVRLYGESGKPPKAKFARWVAKKNAELIKKGYPRSELLGSGATHVPTMLDYIKETFRVKKNRDIADAVCRNRGKFSRTPPGGNKV
jgi:hypothetical protein